MILYGRILIIMSKEHILYLNKLKNNKRIIIFFQIIIFILFIFIWQILGDLDIINTFIFSSPKKVVDTIINLYNK